MKKTAPILIHALLFVLSVVTVIIYTQAEISSYESHDMKYSLKILIGTATIFTGIFFGIIIYAYWLFIPRYLAQQKMGKFLLGLISFIVVFPLISAIIFIFQSGALHVSGMRFIPHNLRIFFYYFSLYGLVAGIIGTTLRLFVQWLQDAQEKQELEKQNVQSELALLKNQLNPHFLFNTLNNIDALIREQSPDASQVINKLSKMTHYMVYDSDKERVPLQEEILYIQNYIDLQKMRIPNEEIIQLSINGMPKELEIAPMLFIPFIENAFKHSSLKNMPGNKIDIRMDIQMKRVQFSCVNRCGDIHKDQTRGIGLLNVQKRLELIYKDNYTLTINPSETNFSIHLDINL